MTDKPTPTDAELDTILCKNWPGFAMQSTLVKIWLRDAMQDAIDKWGTPAGAGEPFGYFHQLLNHEGKGNGVWLGAAERKVVEQAHTPGETSEEIVALYTTPQPTQAQAAESVPAVDEVAEHYRNAIASACEGWTMPDGLRKHLETALWNPPTPHPTHAQPVAQEPHDG